MSSWAEAATAGDRVECPPAGQTARFLETAPATDGDYVRVAITLEAAADRTNAVAHVHPEQTETLTVRAGRIGIDHQGTRRTLGSGEAVTFDAGVAHAFWNAGAERAVVEAEMRPALRTEEFMRFAYGLSQIGPTTASGVPLQPLRAAVLLSAFEGHLYLAGIPVSLQRAGARLLAPFGRLRGHTMDLDEGWTRDAD